jgi:nicotinamide phosphoribosyltransferase
MKMSLEDIRKNPIMLTDCYNLSHQDFKCNVDWEVSHMYNRAKPMILFGFNEIVRSVLSVKIQGWMVDEAEEYAERMGLDFPRELWMRVIRECNGYVPLKVESLPEGKWCPAGTPFAQISNTVEGFGEMVTWFEAIFMMAFFPSSCATEAFHMRNYLLKKQKQYGFDDSFMWKYHSFGFRGHKSLEDAYWAGIAWNLFLHGTDDFHSIRHVSVKAVLGSIGAQAHKVTQQFDSEIDSFKRAIDKTAEKGKKIVALVIDTYDAYRVINEMIIHICSYAKQKGVHAVFRPDSGNTWEQAVLIYEKVTKLGITNASVIIGENMSFETAKELDVYLQQRGVPINFVFNGIGAGFYKHIERDTLGWAMKTAFSNGKPRMKFGMTPLKRSIPDRVVVVMLDDEMIVVPADHVMANNSMYEIIYYNTDKKHILGNESPPFIVKADWEETRQRALSQKANQEVIYLSKEINELISTFKQIYG